MRGRYILAMQPTLGDTLCGGRFRIVAEAGLSFGARAFGPMLRAEDRARGPVWLSLVDATLLPTAEDRARFEAGARAFLKGRDHGLVPMRAVEIDGDRCVVAYDDLPRVHATALDVPVDIAAVESVAVALAHLLARLHRVGRCHGALAPGSVWLLERTPWLVQDGLAALCDPECWSTASHDLDFVAPEVLRGTPVDACADVFAWGVLVSGLLRRTDAAPHRTARLATLARMARDAVPHRRPPDATALLGELERRLVVACELASAPVVVEAEPERAWADLDRGPAAVTRAPEHRLDVVDEDEVMLDPRLGWDPVAPALPTVGADAEDGEIRLEIDRGGTAGGERACALPGVGAIPPSVPAPASVPRASGRPTATPAASVRPTTMPRASVRPSATPAASVRPTATPRASVRPSARPAASVRPTTMPPPSVRPRTMPPTPVRPPRSRGLVVAVVVGTLVAAGAFGWWANRSRREVAANRLNVGLSQAGVMALAAAPRSHVVAPGAEKRACSDAVAEDLGGRAHCTVRAAPLGLRVSSPTAVGRARPPCEARDRRGCAPTE